MHEELSSPVVVEFPLRGEGWVACAFREYDALRDGRWDTVTNGIPGRHDRIRSP